MKLKRSLLAGILLIVGCNERTVGIAGPSLPPEYRDGIYRYNQYEWTENSQNKLVYNIQGPRSGNTEKIYVDFRFNGIQMSATGNYPNTDAFCQIQFYTPDGSMLTNTRVNMNHGVCYSNVWSPSGPVSYIVFDFNGYFGESKFVIESFAR